MKLQFLAHKPRSSGRYQDLQGKDPVFGVDQQLAAVFGHDGADAFDAVAVVVLVGLGRDRQAARQLENPLVIVVDLNVQHLPLVAHVETDDLSLAVRELFGALDRIVDGVSEQRVQIDELDPAKPRGRDRTG